MEGQESGLGAGLQSYPRLLGVIQGPQPPATSAWAECRLSVPTGRLCQGGDLTMPWELGWVGALKNMPLCFGFS